MRGISKEVLSSFNAYTDEDKLYMPYTSWTQERWLNDTKVKEVTSKPSELYGATRFTSGNTLYITEGEIEALCVAEAFYRSDKEIPPIVATTCRVAFPIEMLEHNKDYFKRFDTVISLLDQDSAGFKQLVWLVNTHPNVKEFDLLGYKDNYELIEEIGYEQYLHEMRSGTKEPVTEQKMASWSSNNKRYIGFQFQDRNL
jgi:hypothetical protein